MSPTEKPVTLLINVDGTVLSPLHDGFLKRSLYNCQKMISSIKFRIVRGPMRMKGVNDGTKA